MRCIALALLVSILISSASVGAEEPPPTVDTEMLRWNAEIPGFGGFFYDEGGVPTVYLLDPAQEGAAREAFGADVQIRQGDWELRQLAEWRSRLVPLLALPGAVLLDVDEGTNRIWFGLDATAETREANRERLEEELRASGVPREAVVVEETEPVELAAQRLMDRFEPVPGGAHIAFEGSFCTLGFNVVRNGEPGFLTNSHCSRYQGFNDGTVYHQPEVPNPIGVEVSDPPFYANSGCPSGRICRQSDALFARYYDPSFGDLGNVARTEYRGRTTGSLNVVSTPFEVVRTGYAFMGSEVNKIGRTTGWTYGRVIRTCVDVDVNQSNFTLFCQTIAQAGARVGDSGSPVFRWNGGKFRTIEAVGLLWGATSRSFLFSPIHLVESDLKSPLIFR